jgi:hypothetical protein
VIADGAARPRKLVDLRLRRLDCALFCSSPLLVLWPIVLCLKLQISAARRANRIRDAAVRRRITRASRPSASPQRACGRVPQLSASSNITCGSWSTCHTLLDPQQRFVVVVEACQGEVPEKEERSYYQYVPREVSRRSLGQVWAHPGFVAACRYGKSLRRRCQWWWLEWLGRCNGEVSLGQFGGCDGALARLVGPRATDAHTCSSLLDLRYSFMVDGSVCRSPHEPMDAISSRWGWLCLQSLSENKSIFSIPQVVRERPPPSWEEVYLIRRVSAAPRSTALRRTCRRIAC